MINRISYVPREFRMPDAFAYPKENAVDFELFFMQNVTSGEIANGWVYLPVLFTAYLKRNRFGEDKSAIQELQHFVDSLDRSKKYFTICQFDLGVMVDLSELNIKVFAMAGGVCDYRLPLICSKSSFPVNVPKDVFMSFVGRKTHPVREKVLNLKPRGIVSYLSEYPHQTADYFHILSRSIFGLCPRGFSATSFRIQESIECGAIPVFISDEFYIPHGYDFEKYGVLIEEKDIDHIPQILSEIPEEEIKKKQSILPTIYESLYSFSANKKIILNQLKQW